ncbi:MerR family transcriptional regulator [filamentous cyanobacterium LEGE 11480]|uniref:MerR family transcriptional regulator n=1 Tax=Romeriopsis navalis LEGE 11480 TaxID=2777977 RepID=A0A928VTU4_9CYAN|nr:MerR family transcriptional regulator [Romeriopsis navalis]MBE9032470.1 MerR family transcriptional regulator [Romeriopsis navalis LEGE 11480]
MKSGSVLKPLMKIGELSKQAQVPVGTLRYYETLGLLVPAQRGRSGYRYYAAEAIDQVHFVQKAQTLGFTLQEVQQIMGVRVAGQSRHFVLRQLLDEKIERLNDEIQRLSAFKSDLQHYQREAAPDMPKDDYVQGICQLIDQVKVPMMQSSESSV